MTIAALVLSGLLVLITGIIRGAGASLVRTPRADALHDAVEGDRRADIVADLLEDRPRLQPALGVVHTTGLVLAAIPATWALTRMLEGWPLVWAFVALGLLLVLFGDVVPRSLARRRPRQLAYRWAWLLRPVIALGAAAADVIREEDEESDTPEEHEDDDAAAERELITSVLELGETIVREVMVPRTDMVTIGADTTTDDALDVILEAGRSRVPVLGDGIDDVVGVMYARDLLRLFDEEAEPVPSATFARSPYFVPETKPVLDLMREMQANQVHLAIVVDEFGGTAGLVTIEDLLEEIVGEIADEYDEEEPMVQELGDGAILVDARLGIDELEQLIDVDLPDEEWDTVGGLVLGLAGRVPREGERFEHQGRVFVADRVQGRRVSRVRILAAPAVSELSRDD